MSRMTKAAILLAAIAFIVTVAAQKAIEKRTESQPANCVVIIEPSAEPEPTPTPDTSNQVELTYYYDNSDVIAVAKTLYNECRGVSSTTEKACVVWTMCNRYDEGGYDSIYEVVSKPNQFAYNPNSPVWDELVWLAEDVLCRWNMEKNGYDDVGRVLPSTYKFFHGDGEHNHFREEYEHTGQYWDYSLESPYDS